MAASIGMRGEKSAAVAREHPQAPRLALLWEADHEVGLWSASGRWTSRRGPQLPKDKTGSLCLYWLHT